MDAVKTRPWEASLPSIWGRGARALVATAALPADSARPYWRLQAEFARLDEAQRVLEQPMMTTRRRRDGRRRRIGCGQAA